MCSTIDTHPKPTLPSYPRPVACVQELNFKQNWSPAGVKTGKLTVLANWYACIPPGSGSMPWAWESQQTGHESRGRPEGCPVGLRPGLDVQVSLWLSQVRSARMHSGPGCCSVCWRLTAGGQQLREALRKPWCGTRGFLPPAGQSPSVGSGWSY